MTKVSFSISPSSEYSGLISFRIDLFDLPAFQGTLKSLLQQHNSKASIFQHLAFFVVQLSHPYMTTGKTVALTIWTVTCLLMLLLLSVCVSPKFIYGNLILNVMILGGEVFERLSGHEYRIPMNGINDLYKRSSESTLVLSAMLRTHLSMNQEVRPSHQTPD